MKFVASTFVVFMAAMLLASACSNEPAVPRNVILISLDTVGAKHLGSHGHARPTSPTLDAFAAEGVRFARAIATAPWTLPSHASILTGLYPGQHGALTRKRELDEDVPTLGSLLSAQGFDTAAIVNGIFLADKFGFAHGFDHYELVPEEQSRTGAAAQITDRAIELLDALGDRPAFLFLHYFDVHSDYLSEARYEEMFDVDRSQIAGNFATLAPVVRRQSVLDPAQVDQLERQYDAGIRQLDDELARLFGLLEERGWLDNSLVVVTADHGEEFMEHGLVLHGRTHFEEMLHVPLILHGPSLPRGVTVETPVSLVDILPTVLSLLGLPPADGVSGVDMRRLWETPEQPPANRWIFAEGGPGFKKSAIRSVRNDRYKLIVDRESRSRQLYDLVEDPGETRNVADERPRVHQALSRALDALSETKRQERPAPQLTPDEEARLRSLGYL